MCTETTRAWKNGKMKSSSVVEFYKFSNEGSLGWRRIELSVVRPKPELLTFVSSKREEHYVCILLTVKRRSVSTVARQKIKEDHPSFSSFRLEMQRSQTTLT